MAGLVVGHVLAYLIAVPDPHHRAFVLQRTGHEYLPAMAEAALVPALAGMRRGDPGACTRAAGWFRAVLASGRPTRARAGPCVRRAGSRRADRRGAPLRHLASDHILVIGMAVQVVVAVAAAAFCGALARTSTKLAETVLPRPAPSSRSRAGERIVASRHQHVRPVGNVRAPPSS